MAADMEPKGEHSARRKAEILGQQDTEQAQPARTATRYEQLGTA